MPQEVSEQDVSAIKEWLAKEAYLPNDIDDLLIRKFLNSCYNSLEKTKKCIEKFCTRRAIMPEMFSSRDPLAPNVQTAFSITSMFIYEAEDKEILIHQLNDPLLEKYSFYDTLKAFSIQADYWLRVENSIPESHIIIMDIKDYTLKILPKVNIMYYREALTYMLECMPVRLKQLHVVNCPSYYEKLYALVKPVLSERICSLITFHTNAESLRKSIDKKFLPIQYGGDNQCMKEHNEMRLTKIIEQRDIFLDDNLWKADMTKKPKDSADDTMTGSFKTLSID